MLDGEIELTEVIIGAAIEVHRALGPGLLESAYERCMVYELGLRGVNVQAQVPVPLYYKGIPLDLSYRLDLVVSHSVIVEIKSVPTLLPVHTAQVLTYLRLTNRQVGLLINFYVPVLKQGVRRLRL